MGSHAMVVEYMDVLWLFKHGHTGPFLHAEPEWQGGQQHPVYVASGMADTTRQLINHLYA